MACVCLRDGTDQSTSGAGLLVGESPATRAVRRERPARLAFVFEVYANSASLSPNGDYLVVPSMPNEATIFSIDTGCVLRKLKGHEGYVTHVRFFPDGERVLTLSDADNSAPIRIWDMEEGRELA